MKIAVTYEDGQIFQHFGHCEEFKVYELSLIHIFNEAFCHPGQIICAGEDGETRNPVLWDKRDFPALLTLTGDSGGRQILKHHLDRVRIIETEKGELLDIDRPKDLECLRKDVGV